jgi:hypothetical protein
MTGTITLGSTLPTITDSGLTITGPTASAGITIDGNNAVRVMVVDSGGTLNLNDLTIADGLADTGGGIQSAGTLTVINGTFSGNTDSGDTGGGIYSTGTLTVTDSTFTGNNSNHGGDGGGIHNGGGTLTVTNSTFSGNNATGEDGGGIADDSGTLTVTNSTFSGNTAATNAGGDISGTANVKGTILAGGTAANPNCSGAITDSGYNISDDNSCGFSGTSSVIMPTSAIGLDSTGLFDNGGPTETIALVSSTSPGSGPAIDQIPVTVCTDASGNPLTTDQRGYGRPRSSSAESFIVRHWCL